MTDTSDEIQPPPVLGGPPALPLPPRVPAHVSSRPGRARPTLFNMDPTGVSASWKLVGPLIGLLVASGVSVWTVLGVAKISDVQAHDTAAGAHPALQEKLTEVYDVVITVRNGMYEDRAEGLAEQASEKIENPKRSRDVWQEVREKAIDNQVREKPLRDGLERYLD